MTKFETMKNRMKQAIINEMIQQLEDKNIQLDKEKRDVELRIKELESNKILIGFIRNCTCQAHLFESINSESEEGALELEEV